MPQVPYSPVETVSPTTNAGNDYQQVQATPAAFGAAIGQGEQSLSAGLSDAAKSATALQGIHDNLAVDNAFNQFQDGSTKILHGDPADPSKPGYLQLQGADALNARGATLQRLEDLRQQLKGTLQNNSQALAFDEQSRRLNMYSTSQIGDHADRQFSVYGIQTQQAAETIKLNAITANPFDEDNFQHNLADLQAAASKKVTLAGGSPEMMTAEQQQATQRAYTARAEAMAATNPGAAMAFMKDNQARFDPAHFLALSAHFKDLGDRQWSTNTAASLPIASSKSVGDAIFTVESSNGANAATSDKGAVGPGQIMPGTFQQYAKAGEDINNPVDNRVVARRIIDDLSNRFNGDPARVAVGYFSGPGNVAPLGSSTPWIKDTSDGHMNVSAYVQKVQSLVSPDAPANALDQAIASAPSPEAAQMLIFKQQRLQAIADRQQRAASEGSFNGFVNQILHDATKVTPDQIASDPNLTGEQKIRVNQFLLSQLKDPNKDSQTYGPGFFKLFQQVNAPDGDPNKITDPTMLYSHVGDAGDLSLAGFKELTSEIQGKRTPDGEAEAAMKHQFLKVAHDQISGANDDLHIKDPQGEQNMLRLMGQFFPAYDAARKAGTAPADLLSPDGKVYLGKLITPLVRTTAQKLADINAANSTRPPTPAAPGAPDLTTREGIIAAYTAGKIQQDQARGLLLKGGFATSKAPTNPPVPVN